MNKQIRFWVIKRTIRKYWHRRPINIDDLKHPRFSKREIEDECKELVKQGLMIQKPGLYGMRYGLNTHKKIEIFELFEKLQKEFS